jgi:hypothetical protein
VLRLTLSRARTLEESRISLLNMPFCSMPAANLVSSSGISWHIRFPNESNSTHTPQCQFRSGPRLGQLADGFTRDCPAEHVCFGVSSPKSVIPGEMEPNWDDFHAGFVKSLALSSLQCGFYESPTCTLTMPHEIMPLSAVVFSARKPKARETATICMLPEDARALR